MKDNSFSSTIAASFWVVVAVIHFFTAAKVGFGAIDILGSKVIITVPEMLATVILGIVGAIAVYLAWDSWDYCNYAGS